MDPSTDVQISKCKELVFEKIDELCYNLKNGINVHQLDSTHADGHGKKQSKKTKPTKSVQHVLKNHFSGLSHELQLLADLFPRYKITEGMDDATERKRKDEELKKWVVLEDWVHDLATHIEVILDLTRQQGDGLVLGLDKASQAKTELLKVSKKVAEMKEKIQLSHRMKQPGSASNVSADVGRIDEALLESSMLSADFQDRYQRLDTKVKLCFLCMAFFPENFVIKKRLLVYWWIGEGLIDFMKEKTAEEVADEVIKNLLDNGLIEIVPKMSGLETDGYRIQPLQRFALVQQANRVNFFDFEGNGMPTSKVDSRSCKACLVDDAAIPQDKRSDYLLTYLAEGEEEPEDDKNLQVDKKLRHLQALFNRDRRFVNLNPNRFSNMRNLNLLHLGRWRNASKDHIELETTDLLEGDNELETTNLLEGYIELETTDFLEGLKHMKHLKYISFQGVSNIQTLPVSICKLPFLRVLDLRACHSLQKLPKDIGDLKLLTHLDISECYFLNGLPKSVSLLIKLQVLKGFTIGDHKNREHCILQNLNGLVKLTKLTIRTSNAKFPRKEDLDAFKNFKKLRKLSIAWVQGTQSRHDLQELQGEVTEDRVTAQPPTSSDQEGSKRGSDKEKSGTESGKKFPDLEKLDLLCFPHVECPYWLSPRNLGTMEKLQIRGGKMKTLEKMQGQGWPNVKVLLLKHLNDFTLKRNQLMGAFPALSYLEKVRCPLLEDYPCNEKGVWMMNWSSEYAA